MEVTAEKLPHLKMNIVTVCAKNLKKYIEDFPHKQKITKSSYKSALKMSSSLSLSSVETKHSPV